MMEGEEEEEGTEKENQAVKRGHAQVADVEDSVQRKRQAVLGQSRLPTITRHTTTPTPSRSWREVLGAPPKRGSSRVSIHSVCCYTEANKNYVYHTTF